MRKFLILLCFTIAFVSCDSNQNKKIKTVEITFQKEGRLTLSKASGKDIITLDVELAETDYERETGLMHRASMKDTQGMLFIFPTEFPRSFFMKNTLIPLDIIYLDAKMKIVSFQENAIPLDETGLPSEIPAMYVLEVNAGLAEKWLLEIGDGITLLKN
ncbi:hypothetical protein IMCC3317_16800 [Kordia antarctica]|uniref:DUF192 domain-containing protein n=1 Tax=Kordia antarctica TaxID=1218801 RepID=A0A7L4ZHW1_9FLAO|nr:DUF192 domain-containing protein [Kordia antarctica]QHI36318.1 hypothetical protein IMCC3317_16800 [Kordia antarctica]